MPKEIVQPRIRGFLCTNAHPVGCAAQVGRQAATAGREPAGWGRGKALVLGASTGYGLASRIAAAFGHGLDTVGVFYERPATERRTASAGWYNAAAFHEQARQAGLHASSLNGDAFSEELLEQTLRHLRDELGPLDLVVYSLAAPLRTDPATGVTHRSVLKTIGAPVTTKSIDLNTGKVEDVRIEPATPAEVADTIAVMGGADFRRWVDALRRERLLAPGAKVVTFSYIGPEVTFPVYRTGTIGRAKEDLEATAQELHGQLEAELGGTCRVAICKSVVTQASSAIPVVPLYMSLLFKVMKEAGTHEGPIEQMVRLFDEHMGPGRTPSVDEEGLIRLDGPEMRPEIQREVTYRFSAVDTDNLRAISDYEGFERSFRQLFGFAVPGVDYSKPVETEVPLDLAAAAVP